MKHPTRLPQAAAAFFACLALLAPGSGGAQSPPPGPAPTAAHIPAATTSHASSAPIVVGYLPQWAVYNTPAWIARDLVVSGAAPLLDQVNYAQANIRNAKCVVADPEADLNRVYSAAMSIDGQADAPTAPLRGGLHQLQLLRARYPRIRTVISLEGKASSFAESFQPATRVAFVTSCVDMFLRGHLAPGVDAPGLFDGIDLDWEFPQTAEEGANYMAVLAEFRRQMDALNLPRHPLLTIAAGPGTGRYPGMDWAQISKIVDEVGLMNYDYNGPWQQQTGMLAPLYTIDGDPRPQSTVDATVREYEEAGVAPDKLLLGIPFYGYHWQGASPTNHGLFQAAQSVREDTPYNAIATMVPHSTLYRDEHSQTPWLFDGQTFWTFDDPISARAKAGYASEQGLKGVMIWELSGDTADAQLLRAIRTGLAAPPAASTPGVASSLTLRRSNP